MLPGGLWESETRHRSYTFQALTGQLEVAIAEGVAGGSGTATLPERVSAILVTAVAEVGGLPITIERAEALSVADRQYLIRQLAAILGRDEIWLSADCRACAERFDIFVRQSDLPNQEGSATYPFVEFGDAEGQCRMRVPAGSDQTAIAGITDPEEAQWELAKRCFVEGEGKWTSPERDDEWLSAVDEAFDADSPQVGAVARTACPECGSENDVAIDPYLSLRSASRRILDDVHSLASAYHWSEHEILSLPTERRRSYLDLLDSGATH